MAFTQFTLSDKQLHVALVNEFYLSPAMRAELKSYYILRWQKDYLFSKLTEDGTLIHADVEYIPIFKAMSRLGCKEVKLSFRQPYPGLNIPAYVLIKENIKD